MRLGKVQCLKMVVTGRVFSVRKVNLSVPLNEFDERNLNIVLYLFLNVPDWPTELVEREEIFLEILQLAEIEGIEIGSPEGMFDIKSAPKDINTKLPRN